MRADFLKVDRISAKVIEMVRKARQVRARTAAGTDLVADLNPNYKWLKTSGIISPDKWGNLPGGEIFTTPGEVNGTFVIDGVVGDYLCAKFGDLKANPLTIQVKGNRLTEAYSENRELESDFWSYTHTDENSDRVGEFAIGTNIELKDVIGQILQDEKYPGIHIAFGNPYGAHTGANWYSSTHIDVVGRNFDIWVDDQQIMYFIDVEGGQSTLIVSPSGASMLIDTGWRGFDGRDAKRILEAAKSAGIDRIDYLIVTHYHAAQNLQGAALENQIRKNRIRWLRNYLTDAGAKRAQELGWPNTYTLTKSLAESLIAKHGDGLPIAIVRPAIVETSVRKPFLGWNEGINTSASLSYLLGTSFRQLPSNERKRLDVIPVDSVCQGMTLIAAAVVERRHAVHQHRHLGSPV